MAKINSVYEPVLDLLNDPSIKTSSTLKFIVFITDSVQVFE